MALPAIFARIIPALARLAPAAARAGGGRSVASRMASRGVTKQSVSAAMKSPPVVMRQTASRGSLLGSRPVSAATAQQAASVAMKTPPVAVRSSAASRGIPVGKAVSAAKSPPVRVPPPIKMATEAGRAATSSASPAQVSSPAAAWEKAASQLLNGAKASASASVEASQAAASSARAASTATSRMAQSVADSVRSTLSGQANAQRGWTGMIRETLSGMAGSFMGGGGGSSGVPPPGSPVPPPAPDDDSGSQSNAGLIGMLAGMVAGMAKDPFKMLSPPQGSEAIIGRENTNVARGMASAPGELAKGGIKDFITTSLTVPVAGPMIAGPVALGKASIKAAGSVDEWGRTLLTSVDRLRAFSPEMGAADAESRYRQFGRDMRTANVTGKSTLELSRAYQDLQDNVQPLKDDVTNALNKLTTAALQGLNTLLLVGKYAAAIVPGSAAIQELLREEQERKQKEAQEQAMTQPRQFLKEIRDGKFGENGKRVPKR